MQKKTTNCTIKVFISKMSPSRLSKYVILFWGFLLTISQSEKKHGYANALCDASSFSKQRSRLIRPQVWKQMSSVSISKSSLKSSTSSWEHGPSVLSKPYISRPLMEIPSGKARLLRKLVKLDEQHSAQSEDIYQFDPLWEQIKLEAELILKNDPSAVSFSVLLNILAIFTLCLYQYTK